MKNILHKLINKLGYKVENRSKSKKSHINSLKRFKVTENFDLLIDSSFFVEKLEKSYLNFKLKHHEKGLIVSFQDLNIYVESVEEFYILSEIFVEKDYNFISPKKIVIIDIGANIGCASLYFSTLENVQKIYAFEPVLKTFKQAEFNFSNNKAISKVTTFNNFGLGNNDRDEVFVFDELVKGNTGIRGKLSSSYANNSNTVEVNVKIKNANTEILKIIEENPNCNFVVKMDCEGAEYEIFEILTSDVISKIDLFMIEWHDKGPDFIQNILLKNNFNIFPKELAHNAGIIYASKS